METKPLIVERVYKRTRLKLSHEGLDSFICGTEVISKQVTI